MRGSITSSWPTDVVYEISARTYGNEGDALISGWWCFTISCSSHRARKSKRVSRVGTNPVQTRFCTRVQFGLIKTDLRSNIQVTGQVQVGTRHTQDKTKTRPSPVRYKPRQDKPPFCTCVLVGLIKADLRSDLYVIGQLQVGSTRQHRN